MRWRLAGIAVLTGSYSVLNHISSARKHTKAENDIRQRQRFDQEEQDLNEELEIKGMALLRGVVSADDLRRFKSSTCYQSTAYFLGFTDGEGGGVEEEGDDEYISALRSSTLDISSPKLRKENIEGTSGRYHKIAFDQDTLEILGSFEQKWMQYVISYLKKDDDDSSQIYRSQLQLLTSMPGSVNQFFHQDNARKGLTFIIPLTDVTLEMGPTQLLPGSHRISSATTTTTTPTRTNHQRAAATPGSTWLQLKTQLLPLLQPFQNIIDVLEICWKSEPMRLDVDAGTAIIYDARTLHRGLGNRSNVPRPVLVFRYDLVQYPPPQAGIIRTTIVRWFGAIINAICSVKGIPDYIAGSIL
mmetsp:Transcript_25277/g.40555  ORF Transcript_25277/g.40555 Transcript_25277/m.40555 type:complete len:357 (+) Transcript_25277:300-1370(+)